MFWDEERKRGVGVKDNPHKLICLGSKGSKSYFIRVTRRLSQSFDHGSRILTIVPIMVFGALLMFPLPVGKVFWVLSVFVTYIFTKFFFFFFFWVCMGYRTFVEWTKRNIIKKDDTFIRLKSSSSLPLPSPFIMSFQLQTLVNTVGSFFRHTRL